MELEDIIIFLKQRGFNVVKTESCWWYNVYKKWIYYPFPPYKIISPTNEEIDRLFKNISRIFAIRFLSPYEGKGKRSYIWVRRSPYTIESLSSNTRSKLRRGMKNCLFRALSWDELIFYGCKAEYDTLTRHGKSYVEMAPLYWYRKLSKCSAYEAWGVFIEGNLAAYAITMWVEDWGYILVNRSVTKYLKFYPNNVLIFNVTKQLLARPGISAVSFGWESLLPLKSLEEFKLSMGFIKEPVRQCIILSPKLRGFLNPFICRCIEKMAETKFSCTYLKRLAGFCRIVRESWI